jgi:hypothetical protein
MVLCQKDVKKNELKIDVKLIFSVKALVSKLGREKLFMERITSGI